MLKENVKKKLSILDKASDVFLGKIKSVEKRVFKLIGSFLEKFETKDGRYRNISANRRRVLSLDNAILKILNQGRLDEEVSKYLKNFDDIERLNRLIYEGFLGDVDIGRLARMDFDLTKLDIIEGITLGLTDDSVLRANVIQPIRSAIIQSIAFERTITETQQLLREEILTSDGSSSRMLRYTRQVSQDALSQYDGALNDGIRDQLGLDGMFYLGSVVKTTRQNCFDLVRGVGKFKDLAIRPGAYRVADIPKIIARAPSCETHHSSGRKDCGSGFNPSVTPETFGLYRMGYGCRHSVSYFRLLEDDIPRGLKQLSG